MGYSLNYSYIWNDCIIHKIYGPVLGSYTEYESMNRKLRISTRRYPKNTLYTINVFTFTITHTFLHFTSIYVFPENSAKSLSIINLCFILNLCFSDRHLLYLLFYNLIYNFNFVTRLANMSLKLHQYQDDSKNTSNWQKIVK